MLHPAPKGKDGAPICKGARTVTANLRRLERHLRIEAGRRPKHLGPEPVLFSGNPSRMPANVFSNGRVIHAGPAVISQAKVHVGPKGGKVPLSRGVPHAVVKTIRNDQRRKEASHG